MTYTKYLDNPYRRGNVGDRDHFQHIENTLERAVPGPGEVIVGSADGPVALPAGFSLPDPTRTLSVIGDMHIGHSRPDNAARVDTLYADLPRITSFHTHRVYVGDMIEAPNTSGTTPGDNDRAFFAYANALEPREAWDAAVGNHEMNADRTADEWAAVYGYPDQNYVRDLGFCRLIFVGADTATGSINSVTFSAATLTWLETQLAADGRDAIIVTHAPLRRTAYTYTRDLVQTGGFSSINPNFWAEPDASLLPLLDRHLNARAWICGHTHSALEAIGAVEMKWTGSRHIAHINAGNIGGASSVREGDEPIRSLLVTLLDDRIEVRIRDHGAAGWGRLYGRYVTTLPARIPRPDDTPTAFVFPLNGTLDGASIRGPVTLTLGGTATAEAEGVDLTASGGWTQMNPSALLAPGQGSLVVQCTMGPTGNVKDVAYQASQSGHSRFYMTATTDNLASHTMGAGSVISTNYPIPAGERVTLAVDWDGKVCRYRVNGHDAGSMAYTGFQTWGTLLHFGGRGTASVIGGTLYGAAGFRRPLTQAEHMRLVRTPAREWTMQTVTGG